ncbi:hypothetical protein HXX76_015156 [Chlamydomonas incerta]|uniref:Uncharacterized protein n=1 Tax=Chlamydomonas incerta TaxID=51695 RepID=A0A835SB04_CHLIN|nr:hypothetical protein HXX76_015156 [Chlamydomonas incerta]|eukprot:KAG2423639.1 hypothetical protein HXX76_015156 [Chlamydomonas incerta]
MTTYALSTACNSSRQLGASATGPAPTSAAGRCPRGVAPFAPAPVAAAARRGAARCRPFVRAASSPSPASPSAGGATATATATASAPSAAAATAAAAAEAVRLVGGLSEVVASGRYKGLLLDQFGVLHDGRVPYPGAVEAVTAAAAAGLALLIISNSSRRSAGTLDKLEAMGFPRAAFAGVVTSGELTHRYLAERTAGAAAAGSSATGFAAAHGLPALGRRVMHFNWSSRGPVSLAPYLAASEGGSAADGPGGGLALVIDPREADFLLAHGTEAVSLPGGGLRNTPLWQLKDVLTERAAEAAEEAEENGGVGPPPPVLVVANPDVVTVDGGALVDMPGALAAAYSRAGGRVVLMGKPAPVIYTACAEVLDLPPHELLAVGDSLEHDVAGALGAGIDTLFVAGGIHARDLLAQQQQQGAEGAAAVAAVAAPVAEGGAEEGQGAEQQGVDRAALGRLCARYLKHCTPAPGAAAAAPTFVTRGFVW